MALKSICLMNSSISSVISRFPFFLTCWSTDKMYFLL
jgi:hypothetical protein